MKRKNLLIVIALFVTISSFAQFSGGSGTEADPYKITTAQDLNNIRNYLGDGLCFKLMNNIDLTSFLSTTTTGWSPIGEYSKDGDVGIAFKGNFDGNGNTISGLWISLDYPEGTKGKCAGLFGYMAYGNLQNLNVETNSAKNIKCNNCGYVGILVGYKDWNYYKSNAFISCSVKGNVQAYGGYGDGVRIGLLSGLVTGWVNFCRAKGNVYNNATYGMWTGGLVGYSGSCNESTFVGSVTCNSSTYDAGLLSGIASTYGISNCYAVGNLNILTFDNVATIGGLVSSGIVENSYCSVNVSCNNPPSNAKIGSFMGTTANMPSIQNNFYNKDVCSLPPIGNQTNVPSNKVSGLTASQMTHQANFTNWNFNTIWKIDEGVSMPYLQIIEKDATLSDLEVYENQDTNTDPISLSPYSFNRDSLNYSYNYNLDYSITEITITGKTNYPRASVSGLGTFPLKVGNNTFNIVVISQDGSVQHTYTVSVKRAANNNTKLSSLTVSKGTLSPSFDAATQMYTVSVENSITSINISATPEDPNATVSGMGTIPLNVGLNYIYILVTAANGTSMAYYYVTVTREATRTFTITATAGGNGSIAPSGTISVNEKENRTFAFTPNKGYKNQLVLIDGVADATAKDNGFYTFTNITANHDILVTFAEETNGVEEVLNNQITIYPNPTKEKIFIETIFPFEYVELTDLSGRIVFSNTINDRVVNEQSRSFNISSLPAGIYLVKIKTEEGMIVKKIVKE